MNHPSEWMRYYDAPRGYFRYKHKGTGVIRDSLMNIGKRFKKKPSAKKEKARQVLQKIMEDETKQILKTAADKAVAKTVEKEADKIQAVLRSGDTPKVKPKQWGVKPHKVKPKSGVNPHTRVNTQHRVTSKTE